MKSEQSEFLPIEVPRRLAKVLRDSTGLCHRTIRAIHAGGKIAVIREDNREEPMTLGDLVFPTDSIRLNGVEIVRRTPSTWVMLNKPSGVLSAVSDDRKPCLSSYLCQLPKGTTHVGRLDFETTGLLLLTDDGDLAQGLAHPNFSIEKEYCATIEGRLEDEDSRVSHLRDGIELGDGWSRPSRVFIEEGGPPAHLRVVMSSGKNRVVRRLCRAAKLPLLHLHRVRVGPQSLGDLALGAMRALLAEEVECLWNNLGGREHARLTWLEHLLSRAKDARKRGSPSMALEKWLEDEGIHHGVHRQA